MLATGDNKAAAPVVQLEGGHRVVRVKRKGGDQRRAGIPGGGTQGTGTGDAARPVQRLPGPDPVESQHSVSAVTRGL